VAKLKYFLRILGFYVIRVFLFFCFCSKLWRGFCWWDSTNWNSSQKKICYLWYGWTSKSWYYHWSFTETSTCI